MATAAIGPWSHSLLSKRRGFTFSSLCNEPNVCNVRTRTAVRFTYMKVRHVSPRPGAKSAAPLRAYTRPRVHYDSLLGPFVGSPVLRFHFALFSSVPPPPPSSSPSPSHGRLRFLYLFSGLYHPLVLYPVRLVGAADTCRASASATNGKEREKGGKREEGIKESKGPNKVSLKTRPREKTGGRRGRGGRRLKPPERA